MTVGELVNFYKIDGDIWVNNQIYRKNYDDLEVTAYAIYIHTLDICVDGDELFEKEKKNKCVKIQ